MLAKLVLYKSGEENSSNKLEKLMELTCQAVQDYLHSHIPLSKAMEVSVVSIHKDVVLSAPLGPNVNHRGTAFGGSISTVATLAAWTLVHVRFQELSLPHRLVIRRNTVEYLQPIHGGFEVHCTAPSQEKWDKLVAALSRKGKGRIILDAKMYSDRILAGTFQGEYVALNPAPDHG